MMRHQGATAEQFILAAGGVFVDFEARRSVGRRWIATKDAWDFAVAEARDPMQASALRDRAADAGLVEIHDRVASLQGARTGCAGLNGGFGEQLGAVAFQGADQSLVR